MWVNITDIFNDQDAMGGSISTSSGTFTYIEITSSNLGKVSGPLLFISFRSLSIA